MCGLAGRFHVRGLPPDPAWRARADALLAHRGPDGQGHYQDEVCELVHRRLAIIDLTPTGAQPMTNEDGNVLVVFNGEIYNHPGLRGEMEALGHRFRGTSDTEVLVHLYEEFGDALTDRLRGMFAFALYDRRRRSLLLGRDRYGIKPLYYVVLNNQIVFASEIKAILAIGGFVPVIDRQACYDFLGFGYIPEPLTGFEGVRSLPKGTTLRFDAGEEHPRTFATLKPRPQAHRCLEDAVDSVEQGVLRAALAQSRADVPVAALLSGGIDSSLVVAALCRTTHGAPVTFNVRFPDSDYDETEVALAVARQYGTRHRTVDLRDGVMGADSIAGLLRHFDQPFADSSLLPTYAVCQAIRDSGIICTVSGDGGDEAFGGYASFWRIRVLQGLMRLPASAQRLLEAAGRSLAPLTSDLGRQLTKAVRTARRSSRDTSVLMAALHNYLSKDQKEQLVKPEARAGLKGPDRFYGPYEPPGTCDLEELSLRLTEGTFAVGLPSDMLRKVDMMSMRARIEVRVPMLDEEVVESGLRLPHRFKADGHEGKLVLRALARRWLPKTVAQHRKQGFMIPLDRMVGPTFHEMLEDMLLSEGARIRGFLNVALVERWLGWFREAGRRRRVGTLSREGLYQRVFMLLSLELWMREHRLSW